MKKPKVKVYIDGANMFYTQKKLGWLVDWKKARVYLNEKYALKEVRFYSSYKKGKKGDQAFLQRLKKLGFTIISKPLKFIEDEVTGKAVPKANFDVEITRDILYEIFLSGTCLDAFIFLSGDSDFAPLVWDLKKKFRKKIFIFSSRKTLSWEMRLAASDYFYLDRLKKELFRKSWGLTKSKKYGKSKTSRRRSR